MYWRYFLLFLSFSLSAPGWSAQVQPLYIYNTPPPFYPDAPDNLSHKLAYWLTDHSEGRFKFETKYLPRKRLDNLIAQDNWQGAVIWANPIWFRDAQKLHYLWSVPLATDYNLVLSHRHKPVEYHAPESLSGLKLGGILGHVYTEFEEMVKEGKLTRENTITYQQNLEKLKARRVDVIFLPASAFTIIKNHHPDIDAWLHISRQPRNKFQYYIFCQSSNIKLMDYIDKEIIRLHANRQWMEIFNAWRKHVE